MKTVETTEKSNKEVLTFNLGGVLFALSVAEVQEVLLRKDLVEVPLVPDVVPGLFSLRGQVISALHVGSIMNLEMEKPLEEAQNILVEDEGEIFSFLVDEVGEVLELNEGQISEPPANLDQRWKQYVSKVATHNGELIAILDAKEMLRIS